MKAAAPLAVCQAAHHPIRSVGHPDLP